MKTENNLEQVIGDGERFMAWVASVESKDHVEGTLFQGRRDIFHAYPYMRYFNFETSLKFG